MGALWQELVAQGLSDPRRLAGLRGMEGPFIRAAMKKDDEEMEAALALWAAAAPPFAAAAHRRKNIEDEEGCKAIVADILLKRKERDEKMLRCGRRLEERPPPI